MAFDSTIIHWPSIAEFAAALATIKRPSWCHGITHHNTYIPNEDQWRGLSSMNSMRATYIAKGWTSGPNLYLCAKSPNSTDQGIWQMTPITRPGTHAGACNSTHLGVENVGDFDRAPPSAAQYTLMLLVTRLIMEQWGIPPQGINVHNECMVGRTCPGKHLAGTQLRAALNAAPPKPDPKRYRVRGVAIHEAPNVTSQVALNGMAILAPGTEIQTDQVKDGWAHVPEGFIDVKSLEAL